LNLDIIAQGLISFFTGTNQKKAYHHFFRNLFL